MGSRARTLAVTAVLLAAVACGDGGGASPSPEPTDGGRITAEAWLADICGATHTWVDEILRMQAELQDDLDTSSVKAVKHTMVGYFDDVVAATDQMLQDVDAAGVPDVADGEAAAEAVSTGLTDARDVLQRARDDASDLPTNDQRRFTRRLRAIADEVQVSLTEVGNAMGQLHSTELDRAAEDVQECQELGQP